MSKKKQDANVTWQDIEIGGTICDAGNAEQFETGSCRSMKPVFLADKCKQCGLCFPVCPDDAIPVGPDQKRGDFNYDACKGCAVCAKVCPFQAIEMHSNDYQKGGDFHVN